MNETVCTRCSLPKTLAEMAIRNEYGKRTIRSHCKECQRKAQRTSANKNNQYKERIKEWRQKIYTENMGYIISYLKSHPCIDCDNADIAVLEFDHVRSEKAFNISYGIWQHRLPKIIAEIEKCDVRCANCHRRRTTIDSGRLAWYPNGKPNYAHKYQNIQVPRIMEYLESNPCIDCSVDDPLILEFDHREDKKFNVRKISHYKRWEIIQAEIDKCDVRCCNCHRRRTYLTNPASFGWRSSPTT